MIGTYGGMPDDDQMFEIQEPLPTIAPADELKVKRCAQRGRPSKHYNADPNVSFDALVDEPTLCVCAKWQLKAYVEKVLRIWINEKTKTVQIDRLEGRRWKCVDIYC